MPATRRGRPIAGAPPLPWTVTHGTGLGPRRSWPVRPVLSGSDSLTEVVIAHLYPAELNIYGDTGNIIALRKRLEWRGYSVRVVPVEPGEDFDWCTADIAFGGGGQDSGQLRVAADLRERGNDVRAAVAAGLPLLAVCGLYQLLGESFVTEAGREIEGIGVFSAVTTAGRSRLIGNVIVDSPFGELSGFENHSGQTVLRPGQRALGSVRSGYGNNSAGRDEGAISGHAIGTYLHGPVLPRNPALTDQLISAALFRRNATKPLLALDDRHERAAGRAAARLPQ